GWSLIRICPPTDPASLGKSSSDPLRVAAFSIRFLTLARKALGRDSIKSASLVFAYQTPSGSNLENSRMCSRYLRALLTAQSRAWLSDRPFARPASTTDATSRLTSHSQGAREVSSKSLISKMTLRSGVANPKKFMRRQSAHACKFSSVVDIRATVSAILTDC